jgi:broad specificity phosphatase PhoE
MLKSMRLLLIRHGQTIDNVRGAIGTVIPGPPLTELGVQQAAAVPTALAETPIDAIYASTMLRTQLTAAPLSSARGIDVEVIDGIHEIGAGALEGHSDEDAVRTYMGTIFSWWVDTDARIPGGENGTEFFGRFDTAIERIAAEHDGTVAVVSHGAAIRTWTARSSANLDADFSRTHQLDNTAIVVMEGSPTHGWVTTEWDGSPVGGPELADASAPDPTGEAI